MDCGLLQHVINSKFNAETLLLEVSDADRKKNMELLERVTVNLPLKKGLLFFYEEIIPEIFNNSHADVREPLLEYASNCLPQFTVNLLDEGARARFKQSTKTKYLETIILRQKNGDLCWHKLWIFLVKCYGKELLSKSGIMNIFLKALEVPLGKGVVEERIVAYDCWKVLIDICSIENEQMCNVKHIKLLITPLKSIMSTNILVTKKRFEVWMHLMNALKKNLLLFLSHFLQFCFGPFDDSSLGKKPDKIGAFRSDSELCYKSAYILLEIIGHYGHENEAKCIDVDFSSDSLVKLEAPLINTSNFISMDHLIINSIRGCSIIALHSFHKDTRKQFIKCMWGSLFNIIKDLNDSEQEASLKQVASFLVVYLQLCEETHDYMEYVLEPIFEMLLHEQLFNINCSIFCTQLLFPVVQECIKQSDRLFLRQDTTNNSVLALLNLTKTNTTDKNIWFEQLFTILCAAEVKTANIKSCMLLWKECAGILIESSDFFVATTENTIRCFVVEFMTWPLCHLHKVLPEEMESAIHEFTDEWGCTFEFMVKAMYSKEALEILDNLQTKIQTTPIIVPTVSEVYPCFANFLKINIKRNIVIANSLLRLTAEVLEYTSLTKNATKLLVPTLSIIIEYYIKTQKLPKTDFQLLCRCFENFLTIHKKYPILLLIERLFYNISSEFKSPVTLHKIIDTLAKHANKIVSLRAQSILLKIGNLTDPLNKSLESNSPGSSRGAKITNMARTTPTSSKEAKQENGMVVMKPHNNTTPKPTNENVSQRATKITNMARTSILLKKNSPMVIKPPQESLKIRANLIPPAKTMSQKRKIADVFPPLCKIPVTYKDGTCYVLVEETHKSDSIKLAEDQLEVVKIRKTDIPALHENSTQSDVIVDFKSSPEDPVVVENNIDFPQSEDLFGSEQINNIQDTNNDSKCAIISSEVPNKFVTINGEENKENLSITSTNDLASKMPQIPSETTSDSDINQEIKVFSENSNELPERNKESEEEEKNNEPPSLSLPDDLKIQNPSMGIIAALINDLKPNEEKSCDDPATNGLVEKTKPALSQAEKNNRRLASELKKLQMNVVGGDQFARLINKRQTRTSDFEYLSLRSGSKLNYDSDDSRSSTSSESSRRSKVPKHKKLSLNDCCWGSKNESNNSAVNKRVKDRHPKRCLCDDLETSLPLKKTNKRNSLKKLASKSNDRAVSGECGKLEDNVVSDTNDGIISDFTVTLLTKNEPDSEDIIDSSQEVGLEVLSCQRIITFKNAVEKSTDQDLLVLEDDISIDPVEDKQNDDTLTAEMIDTSEKPPLEIVANVEDTEEIVESINSASLCSPVEIVPSNFSTDKNSSHLATTVSAEFETETEEVVTQIENVPVTEMTTLELSDKEPGTPEKLIPIPTSPIAADTPTRTNELIINTLDISPIKKSPIDYTPDLFDTELENVQPINNQSTINDTENVDHSNGLNKAPTLQVTGNNNYNEKLPNVIIKTGSRSERLLSMIACTPSPPLYHNVRKVTPMKASHGPLIKTSRFLKMMQMCEKHLELKDTEEVSEAGTYNNKPVVVFGFEKEVLDYSATPARSILKRKAPDTREDGLSPPRKRRVNFSDPLITCERLYNKKDEESEENEKIFFEDTMYYMPVKNDTVTSNGEQTETETCQTDEPTIEISPSHIDMVCSEVEVETNSMGLETQGSIDVTNPCFLDYDQPIAPELIDCKEGINDVLPETTSPLLYKMLQEELKKRSICNIGDLARLSEVDVIRLPFQKGKVQILRNALYKFCTCHKSNDTNDSKLEITSTEPTTSTNNHFETVTVIINDTKDDSETCTDDLLLKTISDSAEIETEIEIDGDLATIAPNNYSNSFILIQNEYEENTVNNDGDDDDGDDESVTKVICNGIINFEGTVKTELNEDAPTINHISDSAVNNEEENIVEAEKITKSSSPTQIKILQSIVLKPARCSSPTTSEIKLLNHDENDTVNNEKLIDISELVADFELIREKVKQKGLSETSLHELILEVVGTEDFVSLLRNCRALTINDFVKHDHDWCDIIAKVTHNIGLQKVIVCLCGISKVTPPKLVNKILDYVSRNDVKNRLYHMEKIASHVLKTAPILSILRKFGMRCVIDGLCEMNRASDFTMEEFFQHVTFRFSPSIDDMVQCFKNINLLHSDNRTVEISNDNKKDFNNFVESILHLVDNSVIAKFVSNGVEGSIPNVKEEIAVSVPNEAVSCKQEAMEIFESDPESMKRDHLGISVFEQMSVTKREEVIFRMALKMSKAKRQELIKALLTDMPEDT